MPQRRPNGVMHLIIRELGSSVIYYRYHYALTCHWFNLYTEMLSHSFRDISI